MAQRYKFSIESKSFPLDISGEPIQFAIPCQLVNLSTSKKNVDIYEIALDILK